MMNFIGLLFSIIFPDLIYGVIGHALGSIFDRRKAGFWLGALLGPWCFIVLTMMHLVYKRKFERAIFGRKEKCQCFEETLGGQRNRISADIWTFKQIYLSVIVVNGVF